MVEYDSPLKGQTHMINVREQIQKDIRTFMLAFPAGYDDGEVRSTADYMTDSLCDIVVANFKELEEE